MTRRPSSLTDERDVRLDLAQAWQVSFVRVVAKTRAPRILAYPIAASPKDEVAPRTNKV